MGKYYVCSLQVHSSVVICSGHGYVGVWQLPCLQFVIAIPLTVYALCNVVFASDGTQYLVSGLPG